MEVSALPSSLSSSTDLDEVPEYEKECFDPAAGPWENSTMQEKTAVAGVQMLPDKMLEKEVGLSLTRSETESQLDVPLPGEDGGDGEPQRNTTVAGVQMLPDKLPDKEVGLSLGRSVTELQLDVPLPGEDGEPPEERSNIRVLAIMVALSLSLFVAALDQTIVATAIPTISADLHSGVGYLWIGGAYLLANAGAANIWANLSNIWGRKPIHLVAVALFFGSSIICANAVNMTTMIVGRALQGRSVRILSYLRAFPARGLTVTRRRSLYLGLLEFVWAIAGAVGPIMGGALTEKVSWRWIYWINLPLCATVFLLLLLFLDVHNPKTKMMEGVKAIDWVGSLSILGLTLMLLLGLDFGGNTFPWSSSQVICLIIFGCLTTMLFIFSEKWLSKHPLMPMGMFKVSSNIASLLVDFAHGFVSRHAFLLIFRESFSCGVISHSIFQVFIGGEYYLPLYFQSARDASPLHSGLLILPLILTESFASVASGLIIHQTGRYLELIWIGLTFLTIGTGLYIHFSPSSSLVEVIGFQIVAGIGSGFLFCPPLIALQSMISQDDTAAATATFGFVRNLATSMSIVIGGVVFQNSMRLREPELLAAQLPQDLAMALAGSATANVITIREIEDPLQQLVVKEAFVGSLRNMWILYTCVAACGLLASVFITKQVLSQEHTETETGIKRQLTTNPVAAVLEPTAA
ncbi:hypothetical protein Egran_01033 [Elaphomyces granulatus]|uniref:Major facilitator superfamily (MFS) profile domain-containing protein n=1 Tax=Elaphomyces granulatus TaxID=519963 RepID=A0A232M4A9_9EURO|nr:hypothetical protein Egran_01033 [Elaphomyces granulatus]